MKLKYLALTGAVLLLLTRPSQAQYTGVNLGNPPTDPAYAGTIVTNVDGSWTLTGGGSDIWDAADRCYFFYSWASGSSWEAKVQEEFPRDTCRFPGLRPKLGRENLSFSSVVPLDGSRVVFRADSSHWDLRLFGSFRR